MPGPPKLPLEERRRRGRSDGRDSGGRKLPESSTVVALPGTGGRAPRPPETLMPDGAGVARWEHAWREAAWLSPATDTPVLTRLCELEDLRHGMRVALNEKGFYVTGSQGQERPNPLLAQIRATEVQILALEKECGLTPASRGSLGVGEVKGPEQENPLAAILARAADRGGRRSG